MEPQPDWWFIGGRARPGDTTREAAARNVKRELGIAAAPGRFSVVGTYSMVWQMRQQTPQANGTADVSTVHALVLTAEEEAAGVVLDEKEYSASRFVPLSSVDAPGSAYHPCLQQAVRDLRRCRALDALLAAAAADATAKGGSGSGTDGDAGCDGRAGGAGGDGGSTAAALVAAAHAFALAQIASEPRNEACKVHFVGGAYEYVTPDSGASS